MKAKIIALMLIICILSIQISAVAVEYPIHYSTGMRFYELTTEYCTPVNNASVSGNKLVISAEGSAEYGFYLPFHSPKVTITYSGAKGTTKIVTDQQTYTMELSGSGEYVLDFAANLGYEPWQYFVDGTSHYYWRQYMEHPGERIFTISSTGGITISKIEFEKEKEPATTQAMNSDGFLHPDADEELIDTIATVTVDLQSPIIVVGGARRYIDNNSVGTLPYNNEGNP